MRKGIHRCCIHVVREIYRLALFRKNHGAVKHKAGQNRHADARGLDREDLVDVLVFKKPVYLLCHIVAQLGVDLMVKETVHLQDSAGLYHAVTLNALDKLLQFDHLVCY